MGCMGLYGCVAKKTQWPSDHARPCSIMSQSSWKNGWNTETIPSGDYDLPWNKSKHSLRKKTSKKQYKLTNLQVNTHMIPPNHTKHGLVSGPFSKKPSTTPPFFGMNGSTRITRSWTAIAPLSGPSWSPMNRRKYKTLGKFMSWSKTHHFCFVSFYNQWENSTKKSWVGLFLLELYFFGTSLKNK